MQLLASGDHATVENPFSTTQPLGLEEGWAIFSVTGKGIGTSDVKAKADRARDGKGEVQSAPPVFGLDGVVAVVGGEVEHAFVVKDATGQRVLPEREFTLAVQGGKASVAPQTVRSDRNGMVRFSVTGRVASHDLESKLLITDVASGKVETAHLHVHQPHVTIIGSNIPFRNDGLVRVKVSWGSFTAKGVEIGNVTSSNLNVGVAIDRAVTDDWGEATIRLSVGAAGVTTLSAEALASKVRDEQVIEVAP